MSRYTLDSFLGDCRSVAASGCAAADCVRKLVPRMHGLLQEGSGFLQPHHFQDDAEHYARNLIYLSEEDDLSLYALVWNPGQWTPVHDHGSWGVVGMVRGTIQEQNYLRTDRTPDADEGIELVPGGLILMAPGTVTSFVPTPDHIHRTGVPVGAEQAVSLHMYGRGMNNYHTYDLQTGTRELISVSHNIG